MTGPERGTITIRDVSDPRLADYRDLRDADLRGARRLFTVESFRVVRRFIRSGWPIESLLLEPEVATRLGEDLGRVPAEVPIYVAPEGSMREISGYGFHGGALALGRRDGRAEDTGWITGLLERPRLTILAAEGVVHVDNMGSLFRNAACLGADAVLLAPDCADPLLRKTIRISAGRIFSLPWSFLEPWEATLDRLRREHRFRVIGLDTDPRSESIDAMKDASRTILLLGGEGHGLRERTLRCCDQLCEIPVVSSDQDGDDASLNVAVASAIALHERLRRLRSSDDLD